MSKTPSGQLGEEALSWGRIRPRWPGTTSGVRYELSPAADAVLRVHQRNSLIHKKWGGPIPQPAPSSLPDDQRRLLLGLVDLDVAAAYLGTGIHVVGLAYLVVIDDHIAVVLVPDLVLLHSIDNRCSSRRMRPTKYSLQYDPTHGWMLQGITPGCRVMLLGPNEECDQRGCTNNDLWHQFPSHKTSSTCSA